MGGALRKASEGRRASPRLQMRIEQHRSKLEMGAKDLGVSNDYMKEKMPPMLTDMLNGELAWRQHDGGHTDAPNFKYFIPWASKFLKYERKPL